MFRVCSASPLRTSFRSLHHPEAMLFINNHVREVFKLDRFLYERMCADDDRDLAIRDPFQKLSARDVSRFVGRNF